MPGGTNGRDLLGRCSGRALGDLRYEFVERRQASAPLTLEVAMFGIGNRSRADVVVRLEAALHCLRGVNVNCFPLEWSATR